MSEEFKPVICGWCMRPIGYVRATFGIGLKFLCPDCFKDCRTKREGLIK